MKISERKGVVGYDMETFESNEVTRVCFVYIIDGLRS